LDIEPEGFDVAVMSHSLEHLEDPLGALCRIGELMRPDGSLHVAVPNGAAPGLEIQRQEWGALCYPVHLWYFDPITLSSLLARAGFVVAWSNSADIVAHHVAFWRRRLVADPVPAARELVTALSRRARTPLSGDVLRVVARRAAVPLPSAMAVS
jgi:SAM-dependent methyltransferase